MKPQPIHSVEWMPIADLRPNDYNPNVQPPPEHRLLKVSLLEDGWTQPIVAFDDGTSSQLVIIDGEHRWKCARDEPSVAALTDGLVPVVRLSKDRSNLLMATIRHNRARGAHRVKAMADIVRELLERAVPDADVCFLLQMEPEELSRLADRAGMPERVGRTTTEFSKGWVPK